jgi:hypothetical protein
MTKRRNKNSEINKVENLIRDLLITLLGTAGVKQVEIRKIVGCDINQVSRIVKHIERGR